MFCIRKTNTQTQNGTYRNKNPKFINEILYNVFQVLKLRKTSEVRIQDLKILSQKNAFVISNYF